MTTTVLKLSESSAFLKTVSLKSIKDVRALDVDLLLVLINGDQILISGGAMHALNSPDLALQFSDGQLPLARVFEQIERINVSPEANLTVSSKEITRYNQNNARKKKARQQDDEGDKPIISPDGEKDPAAAIETNGTGGNTNSTDYSPIRSTDNRKQLAEAEISSEKDKSWGVQWPIAAGALALLAAAGGGGGGGGAGAAGAAAAGGGGSGSATAEPPKANLEGAVVLGAIRNATITAYDNTGNALSAATEVVNGKYALVLTRPFYKGPMLLVVRDNTPDVADNYIDEATQTITNLGATPLRALVEAYGVNQAVNVTALTELAVQKAGLAAGMTTLAGAPEVTIKRINSANAAVGAFFKVDAIAGEVVPTHIANSQGVGVVNPAYNAAISTEAQNYGAALKAIANLVLLDDKTYPNQAAVLQKLAEALVFADETGSALKWATSAQGEPLAAASAIQAALFSEALQQTIADLNIADATRAQASAKLAKLQNLPTGTTVADYLVKNHVAIANPVIEINQGLPGQERQWELPSFNTLKLDQGDFMEGGMRVPVPPFAQVVVTIIGKDVHGTGITVTLPKVTADASGNAVLNASELNVDDLLRMDAGVPVTARITVTDGYNVRSNVSLWKLQSDVRVDLNTPPDLANFITSSPIALGEDSYYHNVDGDTQRFPAMNGEKDGVTRFKQIKVSLTRALNATGEALQFAVATKTDLNDKPIFGVWNTVTTLGAPTQIQGGVSYAVDAPLQLDGRNWIKARVVQIGQGFTGGQGNANTANTVLEFTLDTTKPPEMKLNMAGGADNGISTSDGIALSSSPELILAGVPEGGAELHYRLLPGNGTMANSLVMKNAANPNGKPVHLDTWAIIKPGDRLVMQGDSKDGNGKVRLQVRQIDQAGNFSDSTQSFIVDTTGVIEQTVRLTQRSKLLAEAKARLTLAESALASADAANLVTRQADKATAQLAVQSANASLEQAMAEARTVLTGQGVSKIDSLLTGTTVPPEYVSAMVNHLSTLTDAEKVNDSTVLAAEMAAARAKADAALDRVKVYGDPANDTAPVYQDFFDMGILNLSRDAHEQAAQLRSINSALHKLPTDKSDSIAKIQTTTDAYLKVLALANGRDDTATANLPSPDDYAALGVDTQLNAAGARILGGAIDQKNVGEVDTVAKLDAMAKAAQRIALRAGLPAGQNSGEALTEDDFRILLFDGVTTDNVADVATLLNNVPPQLRQTDRPQADRVTDTVDTWAEVRALIKHNIGSLSLLINYANGHTPIDETNPAQTEPFVSNYTNDLLTGNKAVNAGNLAAINSALREVKGEKIGSWAKLANLVGSYNRILALADGVLGNASDLPTAEDYRNIGVKNLDNSAAANASPATRDKAISNTVKLINDVLDSADANRSQIDRVSKVAQLADIAARVIRLAGQEAKPDDSTFLADELNQLHLAQPLTAAQIEVARWGVAGSHDDGNDVATREQLGNVIQKALTASTKIRAYADDAAKPAPTLSDYRDLGIRGMANEQQVQAVNSSLATEPIAGNNVAAPADLQKIATAWQSLLNHPGDNNNAHSDPAIATYKDVGAQQPTDVNTLTLLNSALLGKQSGDIATVDKLNTFTTAANTVRAVASWDAETAKNTATDAWISDFKAMLTLLGVQNLHNESQRAILAVVRLGSDNGDEIASLLQLQEIARKAHAAQLKINAFADNTLNAESPTTGDYSDMGVEKVDATNLASINSALASVPVNSTNTSAPEKVQEIVTSYGRILAAANNVADDNTSSLSKQDYLNVGVATTAFDGSDGGTAVLAVLNSLIDASAASKVSLLTQLDTLATTAVHIMAQVRGTLTDTLVSKQELSDAGITGLKDLTFAAVLAALADSADDGSAVAGAANGKLRLQDLATKADQAQQQLIDYANGKLNTTPPTSLTYKQVGLDLAQRLDKAETPAKAAEALNSALRTTAVTGEQVNTPTKLLTLIDAYNAVLAAADGNANADDTLSTAAAAISVQQLTTLGLTGLDTNPTPEPLLGYVRAWLDAMPKATAQDVGKIQKGLDVLQAIHTLADGTRNATALGTAAPFGPNPDDLLKALAAVGVSVTDATLGSAALTAIDAVQFSSISSPRKLKALIDAYQRILDEANEVESDDGTSNKVADTTPDADPSAQDFTTIGVTVAGVNSGTTTDPARLKLLDDALKYKARSQVNDVNKISKIGEAVAVFMDTAAQPAGSPLPPLNTQELRDAWQTTGHQLGLTKIDSDAQDGNLEQIINALRGRSAASIDSVAKLQAIIDGINAALTAIGDYAENGSPVPTKETYSEAGIRKPDGAPLVTDANLSYINAAVEALNRSDVDTRRDVKTVVNSYQAILDAADGTAGDASGAALTAQHYVTIGVPLGQQAIGMATVTTLPNGDKQITLPDLTKLGLLNSIVGSLSKDKVGTPAKIADLAKTAADLIRLAKEESTDAVRSSANLSQENLVKAGLTINNDVHRKAFLDAVKFKGNLTNATTGEPKSDASATETHDVTTVNTIEKLQAIATAYSKVLTHSGSGDAPSKDDYKQIGVTLPTTNADHALALLNGAVKKASAEKIDTIAELNKLAITVEKLMKLAVVEPEPESYPTRYPEVTSAQSPSLQELTNLGLTGITTDNQVAVLLHKVQTTANDGADIATLTALQTLATAATTAQEKIRLYAETNSGPEPTANDFLDIGLVLPERGDPPSNEDYLTVVNNALQSTLITGAKASNTGDLQKIIIAAQRVVDAADGGLVKAEPQPGRADFIALGLDSTKLDEAKESGVAMLGEIIDASTIHQLTHDGDQTVTIPAKLADLLNAIQALMNTVARKPGAAELTPALLEKLAVNFNSAEKTTPDNKLKNWEAIRSAIAGSHPDGRDVDTLQELQDVVTKADRAQKKIREYAVNNVDSPTATPTVNDYKQVGLVSFPVDPNAERPPRVTAENLGAINAALRTTKIDATMADTPANLDKIVTAYLAILARANGAAADDPTKTLQTDHFIHIGAEITGVTTDTTTGTDAAVRALLDSVIASKSSSDVDSPSKINALGELVNKVVALANTAPNADDSVPDLLSTDNLIALGITSGEVDFPTLSDAQHAAALPAVFYAISASANDGSAVNSLTKLQDKVSKAIKAYKKIISYAAKTDEPDNFATDDNRPNASDLEAMGLSLPTKVKQDNAIGVAGSLSTPSIDTTSINTPSKLKTLVNHWDTLFKLADGAANAESTEAALTSFTTLLGKLGLSTTNSTAKAIALLHSTLDALDARTNTSTINTPKKLAGLLDTAKAITELAGHPTAYGATALPSKLSAQELINLGILPNNTLSDAASAVISALAAQANVDAIDSITEISAIATKALSAHTKITNYAKNANLAQPTTDDYLNIGLVKSDSSAKVTTDNLGAINSALASTPIDEIKAGDPALIDGIIEAYDKLINWNQLSDAAAPSLSDYTTLGLTDVSADSKGLLDSALKQKLPIAAVKDHAKLSSAAAIAAKITAMANGSEDTATTQLPDANAYAALGLTMGNAASDKDTDGSATALLNSVIDRQPAAGVDEVSEVQALLDAVNKLMDSAAKPDTALVPTVEDLLLLGIDIRSKTEQQKGAILHAIGTSGTDGQNIKSLSDLQSLIQKAEKALKKIRDFAENNSAVESNIPTHADYLAIGIRKIAADEVDAVNAALATAHVTGEKADSWNEVQAIADVYIKIHAAANGARAETDPVGTVAVPTKAELELIGVNLGNAPDDDRVSLVSTAIDALAWSAVDTPAEIGTIATSAAKLLAAANQGVLATAAANLITVQDLKNLGIPDIEEEALPGIRELIGTTSAAELNTSAKLQAVIDGLLKDIKIIRDYATETTTMVNGVAQPPQVPDEGNYSRAGVIGVTSTNLASINAAVRALHRAEAVNSKSLLQEIVRTYQRILDAADGTPGIRLNATPITRDDLIRIGVDKLKLPDPSDVNASPDDRKLATAVIGLLSSALEAQLSDKSTVKTPAAIGELADLARKVVDYAKLPLENEQQKPTRDNLNKLGVKNIPDRSGAIPSTLDLIDSALLNYPADKLVQLTLEQLQTIATAAAKLRALTSIAGVAADAVNEDGSPKPDALLTYAELTALRMEVEDQATHIKLLNEVLGLQPSFLAVSTTTKLADLKLADIVKRVMQLADADTLPPGTPAPQISFSDAELKRLGLKLDGDAPDVTDASKSAFLAAIRIKSPADLDTLAKLKDVAVAARIAHAKILAYARDINNGEVGAEDSTPALPTVNDFLAMGVTGVDTYTTPTADHTNNMAQGRFAILSSLASSLIGAVQTTTAQDVQDIVDAYNKVLALADGVSNTQNISVSADDYSKIGNSLGAVANRPDYLKLLNSVIDAKAGDAVNTPAEITTLAQTVAKVLDHVNSNGAHPPSKEDLELLGVSGLTDDDLPAVLLKLQKVSTDKVNTLGDLDDLADKAVAAQQKIRTYAGDKNQPAPVASDYAAIAVTLPVHPAVPEAVAAAILSAVNQALASDPVNSAQAGTPQKVQDIVDSYTKLLKMADGVSNTGESNTGESTLPVSTDYQHVGLEDQQLLPAIQTSPAKLRLLNDLVDQANDPQAVDTPAELDALAKLANKVIKLAAQAAGDAVAIDDELTDADYTTLGLGSLTDSQKAAIISALQAKSEADVDTLTEIKDVADKAKAALLVITDYARTNSGTAPTLDDYKKIGVTVSAELLPSVNAALATTNVGESLADTPSELRTIIASYGKLRAQADGSAGNTADVDLAKKQVFTNIGVDLTDLTNNLDELTATNAVQLLSSFIDSRSFADVDTPAKIVTYASLVKKIVNTVKGTGADTLALEDLTSLGIDGATNEKIAVIRQTLAALKDDGSQSNTWTKIDNAVFSVLLEPTLDKVAGDNTINQKEYDGVLTLSGMTGKDSTVTLQFANNSSVNASVQSAGNTNSNRVTWSYTLTDADKSALVAGNSNNQIIPDLRIRSFHAETNVSSAVAQRNLIIDITPPVAPTLALDTISVAATATTLALTNSGTVSITTLEASTNEKWQYRIDSDSDDDWQPQTADKRIPVTNAANADKSGVVRKVQVREIDSAGNEGSVATLQFTLDSRVEKPVLTLNKISVNGTAATATAPAVLDLTNEGTVNVTDLEAGATWKYKIGTDEWKNGSGTSFVVPGKNSTTSVADDGEKTVKVKQTDKAGNTSAEAEISFTLDTFADVPTLSVSSIVAGTNPAGEELITNPSIVLKGRTDKGEKVNVFNGDKKVGTVTASTTDGEWTLALNSTLKISGLKRVDGTLSAANGTYQLLTLAHVRELTNFASDFAVDGKNSIDDSRPVYAMDTAAGEKWYIWSAVDGDYRISRKTGADDWYREIPTALKPTAFPEEITAGMAMSGTAEAVRREVARDGASTHQKAFARPEVNLIATNSPREGYEFSATHTDPAGNTSAASAKKKLRIDTTAPAVLDVDANTPGVQTAATIDFTLAQLNTTGINLASNVRAPDNTDIQTLVVEFYNQGSNPKTNELILGSTSLLMRDNHALRDDQAVGTVSGLSYAYDATSDKLTLRKTSTSAALNGAEVKSILEAIKIKNTATSIAANEQIKMTVALQDFAKQDSPLAEVTLNILNAQPALDMDSSLAGVQHQTKVKYQNVQSATTSIVEDVIATSSASEIRIINDFPAFDSYEFMDADNGTGALTRMPLNTPFVGTIGGVANVRLSIVSATTATSITRNGSDAEFSASEIQAILKALKFGTSRYTHPYRFDFSLVKNGAVGPISSTYLTTDFIAPALDLDVAAAGIQNSVSRPIGAAGQRDGASLFAKPIGTPTEDDTKSINLRFAGAFDITLDKLICGDYTLSLDSSTPVNLVRTIGGVRDIVLNRTRGSGSGADAVAAFPLVLTKTGGASFTGAEVKAVLEALKFKTTSTDVSARFIDITLTDQADNTSTSARASITLDNDAPPPLTMSLVSSEQLSYDYLEFKETFGPNHKNVFAKGDSAVDIPLSPGKTPADFLASIKGLSATWGGKGIAGRTGIDGSNLLNDVVKSYKGFELPPKNDVPFHFSHQGGTYVKGTSLSFAASPDGTKLLFSNKGSFNVGNEDIYNFNGQIPPHLGDLYGIGNIKLLYEVKTTLATRTPTMSIKFDGSKATQGAVIGLYEGERLITSKSLSVADIQAGEVRLTVPTSLDVGTHNFTSRYTEVSGDESISGAVKVEVKNPAQLPSLENLTVSLPYSSKQPAQSLGASDISYAVFTDPDKPGGFNNYDQGPTFKGRVSTVLSDGTTEAGARYLISVSMGGKLLGFNVVQSGDFTIETGASLLTPGFYKDLTFTVTNISADSPNKGQSTTTSGLALGYYWAPQALGNLKGGKGDDAILLGSTAGGANTQIETGDGKDTLILGTYGKTANLEATIIDFKLKEDTVKLFTRNVEQEMDFKAITAETLSQFAPASGQSAFGSGTKMVINLDGTTTGSKYTLYLPTVPFNYEANTKAIFGIL